MRIAKAGDTVDCYQRVSIHPTPFRTRVVRVMGHQRCLVHAPERDDAVVSVHIGACRPVEKED